MTTLTYTVIKHGMAVVLCPAPPISTALDVLHHQHCDAIHPALRKWEGLGTGLVWLGVVEIKGVADRNMIIALMVLIKCLEGKKKANTV